MALNARQLFPNAPYSNSLTASAAVVYDVPGATLVRMTNIYADNYDTDVRIVTIYLVPDGSSAIDANRFMQFEVLPGTPYSHALSKILPNDLSVYAKADVTTKVNLFIDGTEETGASA